MFEDGSAARSECAADGEFLLTGQTASEEKIGDVDAGDEQDEGYGAEEKPERLLAFAGKEVVFSGSTKTPQPLLLLGFAWAMWGATESMSARAC